MNEQTYQRLREFLDRLPGGFPVTETGVELKILRKLFTPEEAEIALQLSVFPETLAAIAAKLKMPEAEAAAKLENMAKQGLLNRFRVGDNVFYMALQFVIGIYEFHLNSLDRELAELMEEYLPALYKIWHATPTKQLRVVPIHSAVDATLAVDTYDRVRELIKGQSVIAVAPCICAKEKTLMGGKCDRPTERCLTFGIAAQYYIENGLGRKISEPETLEILELAEKSGLVLSPSNAQEIMNICCCCGCCCGVIRGLKTFDRPADHVQSSFQARIDPELCTACGACLDRCQIQALKENDTACEVDLARCIGCGLCLPTCPEDAISLAAKPRTTTLPKNWPEMSLRIMKERGII